MRVPRQVTKSLTVQYDRVIYMLDDTAENRALIHQYLDVFGEYPDGRIEIRVPRVKQDESSASIRMRVLALRQRWRA